MARLTRDVNLAHSRVTIKDEHHLGGTGYAGSTFYLTSIYRVHSDNSTSLYPPYEAGQHFDIEPPILKLLEVGFDLDK